MSIPTSSSADVLARVADGWRSIAGWFRMVPSARLRGRDADPGAGAGADMGAGPGTSAGATAGARAGTAATAGAGAGSAELASAAAEGGVGAGAGAGAGTPTQTRLGNGFDHATCHFGLLEKIRGKILHRSRSFRALECSYDQPRARRYEKSCPRAQGISATCSSDGLLGTWRGGESQRRLRVDETVNIKSGRST